MGDFGWGRLRVGWVGGFGCLRVGWLGGWGLVVFALHTCACACTHAHTHTCMHGEHDNFMQMATPIRFLGNSWEFPMMSYMCVHACMCVSACACVHVWGAPSHHPTPIHPPHPQEDAGISKNSIALELIKIYQFCLKI